MRARVRRLGEAGAKAHEDRCNAEIMKDLETTLAGGKPQATDMADCKE